MSIRSEKNRSGSTRRTRTLTYDAREEAREQGARHREWDCPSCGGVAHLRADLKPHHVHGELVWKWICNDCGAGTALAERVADACSERDGQKYDYREMFDGPPAWLGEPVEETGHGPAVEKDLLPYEQQLEQCHARLLAGGAPLDYLTDERGLTLDTIVEHQIGYAGRDESWRPFREYACFTLPVRTEDGALLNVRKRLWPRTPKDGRGKPIKYLPVKGHGSQLYPWPPDEAASAFIVCEGELDCLLTIQHGFSAVTSTAGRSWDKSWNPHVEGRYVAVIYDADSESVAKAAARAADFRAAGAADAWAVDLRRAGLRRKQDLTDFFVTYEHSASALRRLINTSRKDAA